ncbi:hypothetical protein KJZ71_04430 [Patescibacteria group bacterium]|uniref:Uncharacterized protein n=1 Tax=candidate division WWE3 bacterium TaxID=2053526 RepID=A0A928TT98_UNCKA|nr:hypothetical protein [candidate division WWE3 bacterium]MCL4733018.1 hypothetical protein [Patescibacteria group bacterium]MDL1953291.1 hypothetical protein [Candidatus Uhrbacteria bacterium UHB]RIL00520.1 MAG: hypothetical protein DCC77_03080 [Candidatus Uhrbacteria bacterium]
MKLATKRVFVIVLTVLVSAALAYGIYLAGSPGQERLHRLDEQRVSHLQQIASSVDSFYTQEARLPSSLDELRTSRFTYLTSVADPETDIPYEYRMTADKAYELCAVFNLPTPDMPKDYGPTPDFWRHEAGRMCYVFDVRTLDVLKPALPVR